MKTTITVKRPDGKVEQIEKETTLGISEKTFVEMKKATMEAGKGELLSFVNHYPGKALTDKQWEMAKRGKRELFTSPTAHIIKDRERKYTCEE